MPRPLVDILSVISSLATTLALLVMIYVEWPKLKGLFAGRAKQLNVLPESKFIGKLRFIAYSTLAGALAGCVSGLLAAVLFWFILAPLDPRPFMPLGLGYYIWYDLSFFIPNWAVVGLILGLVFDGGSNELASGLRDGVVSVLLGFALGASVGLLTNIATFFGPADVHQSTTLSIALSAAMGGIVFGIMTRGAIKLAASQVCGDAGPDAGK